MKIIFTKGMQASGKSTWAKNFIEQNPNYKRVCRDDLRHMVSNYTFNKENEKLITHIERSTIQDILMAGYNLVIDKMNLNQKDFENDKQFIIGGCDLYNAGEKDENKKLVPEFEVKEFPVTLEEAVKRDSKRDFKIGKDVLMKTWEKYKDELNAMLAKVNTVKIPYDPNLKNCVVCDVDGTLAIRGPRNPYDFKRIMEDELNKPVADLLAMLHNNNVVFIVSGRDDNCMDDTIGWLAKHGIAFNYILMRKTGDRRKDSIVKRELFEAHIKGKFNCTYWIDDRRQVIDMVRDELGLTCLDVAGHEF